MPASSLHQPFDEAVGVLSEEEVSSCAEELEEPEKHTEGPSVFVYSELEICVFG